MIPRLFTSRLFWLWIILSNLLIRRAEQMHFNVECRYHPRYLCARCRLAYLKSGLFKNLLHIEISLAHRCHESPRIEAPIFRAIDGNCARRCSESYKRPRDHFFRRKAFCQRLAACRVQIDGPVTRRV